MKGKCKFGRDEGDHILNATINKYSCDQVSFFSDQWKKEYKEMLKADDNDNRYQEYCKNIDDFLSKCDCNWKTGKEYLWNPDLPQCKADLHDENS